ncbi:MAG: nitroreductase family protein [Planctomycetota bacterium]
MSSENPRQRPPNQADTDAILRLLGAHRSIRSYTDDPVPEADLAAAVQAGQAAATSSAVQAYCAIRITDPARRARLAELTGPQAKVRLAPEFLVICADSRRHRLLCQRDNKPYDQRLEGFLVAAIDAALFAQNMTVALEAMGYGTCYIGGLRNHLAEVITLLNIPEGVYPLFGLCVGKPAEQPSHRPRLPIDAVLFEGAYPADADMLERIDTYDATYRDYLTDRGAKPEQIDGAWSAAMATKHATPSRTDLAETYIRQGASLD